MCCINYWESLIDTQEVKLDAQAEDGLTLHNIGRDNCVSSVVFLEGDRWKGCFKQLWKQLVLLQYLVLQNVGIECILRESIEK